MSTDHIYNAERWVRDEFEQGTPEWHQARMQKVTGSCASKIATAKRGKAFTATAKTYMEKIISDWLAPSVIPEELRGKAIEWGNTHEPTARMEFAMTIECRVEETGFVQLNPFMGCSDDGSGLDEDGRKFVVEIKCPLNNHVKHLLMARKNEGSPKKQIPTDYYWQCVYNAIVTQSEYFYFVSFDPRVFTKHRFSIVRVEMEDIAEDVQQLKEATLYFVQELIKELSALEVFTDAFLAEQYSIISYKPTVDAEVKTIAAKKVKKKS